MVLAINNFQDPDKTFHGLAGITDICQESMIIKKGRNKALLWLLIWFDSSYGLYSVDNYYRKSVQSF